MWLDISAHGVIWSALGNRDSRGAILLDGWQEQKAPAPFSWCSRVSPESEDTWVLSRFLDRISLV